MSLTILSVAYPFTPVGPDSSGGSEQILSTLDRQLTQNGHRSLVIAVQGSEVAGELIPSPAALNGELNEEVRRWGQRVHQRLLLETLNRYPVDLVHMHSLDFHTYLPASSVPVLATLHLPIDWYPRQIFQSQRKNFFLNCVSESQQRDCPDGECILPFVRNGIDVRSFCPQSERQPFLLALGRICPEKGFHLALDAAKKAGAPLILAGELFPYRAHLEYFQNEIEPRLDADRRFIGPVGAAQKRELLAQATALLVPSLVAETSSLVTMEALASGTPVIAFRVGALPDLIDSGITGFLVPDVEEMTDCIRRVPELRRHQCRTAAEKHCDSRVMVKQYLSVYSRILKTAGAQERPHPVRAGLSWLADVS